MSVLNPPQLVSKVSSSNLPVQWLQLLIPCCFVPCLKVAPHDDPLSQQTFLRPVCRLAHIRQYRHFWLAPLPVLSRRPFTIRVLLLGPLHSHQNHVWECHKWFSPVSNKSTSFCTERSNTDGLCRRSPLLPSFWSPRQTFTLLTSPSLSTVVSATRPSQDCKIFSNSA